MIRASLIRQTFIAAILIGGVCASAEAADNIHHSADVRLEPASRSVQVTDEVAMEAGGTVRFRLTPRLTPSLVEVNGAQVTTVRRAGGLEHPDRQVRPEAGRHPL